VEKPCQWQEIAVLGKRICDELGGGRELNTLRTWMAHRIAELIKLADAAKSDRMKKSLQKECADLILSLWRLERGSSSDNPIHTVNRTLSRIAEMHTPLWRRYSHSFSDIGTTNQKSPKQLGFDEIVQALVDLGDQEQELLFALVCDELPDTLPEDVAAAEELHGQTVDSTMYDKFLKQRQHVHDEPLAEETPMILDTRDPGKRREAFSCAILRVLEAKSDLVRALEVGKFNV